MFDPRYMLLNSRERKSCFEEFIRSRAEEERKEKRSKLKAQRDEFRKLLEDSKLHPKYGVIPHFQVWSNNINTKWSITTHTHTLTSY